MIVQYKNREFAICSQLAVVLAQIVVYCDRFNCPLRILHLDDFECEVSTLGWTSKSVYKLNFELNRDYSELAKANDDICRVLENKIRIVTNKSPINKFVKE